MCECVMLLKLTRLPFDYKINKICETEYKVALMLLSGQYGR